MLRLLFILLALAASPASGNAGIPPGAGSFTSDTGESHAWVSLPTTGPNQAIILHLPPRIDPIAQSSLGDGAARTAATLPHPPEALAAWDNRLFMVFPPQPAGEGRARRQILTTAAVRGTVGGQWGAETEGRRMRALPSLPGESHLFGIVGTPHGPAALLRSEGAFRLLLLTGAAWRDIRLPEGFTVHATAYQADRHHIGLVAIPDGIGLFMAGPGGDAAALWLGTVDDPHQPPAWLRRQLPRAAADGSPAPLPAGHIFNIAGQFVYLAQPAPGRLELWSFTHGDSPADLPTAWRLATLADVAPEWTAAPLDQVGRIAIVWAERSPARSARWRGRTPDEPADDQQPPPDQIRHLIAEVSIFTGAVLYEGPLQRRGPVSPQEMRLLAIVLLGLMAVIIVFLLRPDTAGPPVTLPRGYAFAEPGRRLAASAFDLVAAAFIAGQLTGVGIWELLTLRGIFAADGGTGGISAILALVVVGFIMTTLGEGFAGRSLGKLLFGCEVVRPIVQRTTEGDIVPTVDPPGLRRAALRNLVKWTLPPVAMAGLGTMDRRHRGDLAAGTAVVIRIEEAETA